MVRHMISSCDTWPAGIATEAQRSHFGTMRFDPIDILHRRLRRVDTILARVGAVIDKVPGPGSVIALHRRSFLRNTRADVVRAIGMVARGVRRQNETLH